MHEIPPGPAREEKEASFLDAFFFDKRDSQDLKLFNVFSLKDSLSTHRTFPITLERLPIVRAMSYTRDGEEKERILSLLFLSADEGMRAW